MFKELEEVGLPCVESSGDLGSIDVDSRFSILH
jgi:hypothetical protein